MRMSNLWIACLAIGILVLTVSCAAPAKQMAAASAQPSQPAAVIAVSVDANTTASLSTELEDIDALDRNMTLDDLDQLDQDLQGLEEVQ